MEKYELWKVIDYIEKNKMHKEYLQIMNNYNKTGFCGCKGAPVYLWLFYKKYMV